MKIVTAYSGKEDKGRKIKVDRLYNDQSVGLVNHHDCAAGDKKAGK